MLKKNKLGSSTRTRIYMWGSISCNIYYVRERSREKIKLYVDKTKKNSKTSKFKIFKKKVDY